MVSVTELKNTFDGILRLLRSANTMKSLKWRNIVLEQAVEELKSITDSIEKELLSERDTE